MKRHLSLLISFFSLTVPFFAQGQPNDISGQAALVKEFDAGGIKVILKRRPNSPTVSGGLFIKGGARNIDEKTAGVERLMLNTAIEAGKNTPRTTVRRELSRTGSSISAGLNNDYSVLAIATTRADFDRTFEIFSDVALNPLFAEDDLNRNREQLLAGLRESSATPEAALDNLENRIIYAGHPYANDVNGTPATMASFTAADLRAHHKKVMESSRLLFVFVGDIEPEKLRSLIVAKFGKLPKGTFKDDPIPQIAFTRGTLDTVQRNLPTNYVKGTFAAPSLASPDYFAMRVAMSLLQSLVYQEVRGRLQLSYAPDAEMEDQAANTANISVSTTDPNTATAAMINQIRLLQERTLPENVIDDVAAFFLTRYYMNQETSAAQAGELARYELIGGGWRNAFEFINGVRRVTPQDLRNVSNKYMRNLRFTYVGDASALNRSVFVPQS